MNEHKASAFITTQHAPDAATRPCIAANKPYFTSDTQAAIEKFCTLDVSHERDHLYRDAILPAFDKLVESLIFMYKFTASEPYEILKSDCIAFLYEKLHRFDPSRGTKAFSYFNVIAKNWLIIRSRNRSILSKRNVSIDDPINAAAYESHEAEQHDAVSAQPDEIMIRNQLSVRIIDVLNEIRARLLGQNELRCLDAILTLFRSANDIDMLNKRAVFIYLRDLSGLDQKKMTVAMSIIRQHYVQLMDDDHFSLF